MIALCAMHAGPRRTIEALKPSLGPAIWADSSVLDWGAWLRRHKPKAVLRGASELPRRDNPEALLADAALAQGLPVFAVEDFPGNFRDRQRLSALFVESAWVRRHHQRRGAPGPLVVAGNPRYGSLPPAPSRQAARKRLGLAPEARLVLWAGQPDTAAGRAAVAALRPVLSKLGATLLYKAHPRARATAAPRDSILAPRDAALSIAAADLVVTAFSSLALEAALSGTPAFFLLAPGAGREYLRRRTGLTELPWIEEGAAFGCYRKSDLGPALARALYDEGERGRRLANAAALAEAGRRAPSIIAQRIKEMT